MSTWGSRGFFSRDFPIQVMKYKREQSFNSDMQRKEINFHPLNTTPDLFTDYVSMRY